MIPVKKEFRKFTKSSFKEFVLGGDIGGTNTNIGVFGVKNKPELLFSFHFKSQQLKGLHKAVNYVLDYSKTTYNISITKACFGVAGVVSAKGDFVKITNIRWNVSKSYLLRKTKLKKIILINDFTAIGYSINVLSKQDIAVIKKAKKIPKAPIAIIGAGTGLGKTALIYNEQLNFYTPLASEGGHLDFSAQSREELDLVNFFKRLKKMQNVTYENLLSGPGLVAIYSFLRKNKKVKHITPEFISKRRKTDSSCKAAFEIFKSAYARFAKGVALDSLAFGGIYIAGGIAAKNRDIFDKNFIRMFIETHKLKHILKQIPIYLILNYDSGMIGAGFAAMKFL